MTTVFINPGSGPVKNGTVEQSTENIKKFIEDLGVDAEFELTSINDDGRHSYEISFNGVSHEIDMPSIPLENVRYLGNENQNIWNFPRLYVDGSSWVWKYAIGVCFQEENED